MGYKRLKKLLRNFAKSQCNKTFYSSMMVGQNKLEKSLRNSAKSESNKNFYSSMTVGQNKLDKLLLNSTKSQYHKTFYSALPWDTKSKKNHLETLQRVNLTKLFIRQLQWGKIS